MIRWAYYLTYSIIIPNLMLQFDEDIQFGVARWWIKERRSIKCTSGPQDSLTFLLNCESPFFQPMQFNKCFVHCFKKLFFPGQTSLTSIRLCILIKWRERSRLFCYRGRRTVDHERVGWLPVMLFSPIHGKNIWCVSI